MSAEESAAIAGGGSDRSGWRALPRPLRLIAVTSAGGTLLVVGIALLVLPGPGLVLIAAGTAVLATEFPWAARVMATGRGWVTRALGSLSRRRPSSSDHREEAS